MSHVRLKRLKVKGLRSFAAESEVEFPETGMVLFRGKNLDSGGSSGSGKSSLLLAITYLFGFCRYPATALQSWLTEEPLEVTGTLSVGDDELIITRGQKLSLTLNGKKVAGGAKQLEEKITKLVGLPPELLAALTYRGQKQPGLFLSKTDSEKKEFLTTLLDLGKFEAQVEESANLLKALEAKITGYEALVNGASNRLQSHRAGFKAAVMSDEKSLQSQLQQAIAHGDRLRKQISDVRGSYRGFQSDLEAKVLKIYEAAEPEFKAIEARIATLQASKPDLSKIDSSQVMYVEADLNQAREYLEAELKADQQRYQEQRRHADSVHAQLILMEKKLAQKPALEKRIDKLRAEIIILDASNCPTCSRQWSDAGAKATELVAELAKLIHEYEDLGDLKPEIERLQQQYQALGEFKPSAVIEELRGIVTDLSNRLNEESSKVAMATVLAGKDLEAQVATACGQLAAAKAALNERVTVFRANQTETFQGRLDELESLERELLMSDSQANGFRAALNRVQIDNAREKERVASAETVMKNLETEVSINTKALSEARLEQRAELDFQKLIGREGFLGAIFDEVLWEISEETNRLLSQFPNTAHLTLNFRSESTSQKGTIKKSITPVVSIGGFEAPLSSGLSGGMETAVELAVDLAVAQVVSRRTGAVPGWMILDESFTGLGPVETEGSMEILRAFAEDKLVLVVDHASEFKSMFTQHVDVEYQGGFSRVVQGAVQ